ncbi:MAG: hypothetical protein IJ946_04915 [Clostridia bacterium]|nr:hypothetical protein [Clostridia bacterium]
MEKYVVIGIGGSGSDVVSLVAEKLIEEKQVVNEDDVYNVFDEKISRSYFLCFRVNKGLSAVSLPKMSGENDTYRKYYLEKVDKINNMPKERRERTPDFPHIDKNWHNLLPPM